MYEQSNYVDLFFLILYLLFILFWFSKTIFEHWVFGVDNQASNRVVVYHPVIPPSFFEYVLFWFPLSLHCNPAYPFIALNGSEAVPFVYDKLV